MMLDYPRKFPHKFFNKLCETLGVGSTCKKLQYNTKYVLSTWYQNTFNKILNTFVNDLKEVLDAKVSSTCT